MINFVIDLFLQPTIGAIAEALGMSIYELNKVALESLQTVMHTCWPRYIYIYTCDVWT